MEVTVICCQDPNSQGLQQQGLPGPKGDRKGLVSAGCSASEVVCSQETTNHSVVTFLWTLHHHTCMCVWARTCAHTHTPHANSHTFSGTNANVPTSHTNTYILTCTHKHMHIHSFLTISLPHIHATLLPSQTKTIPYRRARELSHCFRWGMRRWLRTSLGEWWV